MARDSKAITYHLPPTHKPYLPLLPSRRRASLLLAGIQLFIAPTHKGMARLSWPGWLVIYRDSFPAPGVEPPTGHPSNDPSTNRAPSALLIKTNVLPLRQTANRKYIFTGRPPSTEKQLNLLVCLYGHCQLFSYKYTQLSRDYVHWLRPCLILYRIWGVQLEFLATPLRGATSFRCIF